jgi:hypothetical protein
MGRHQYRKTPHLLEGHKRYDRFLLGGKRPTPEVQANIADRPLAVLLSRSVREQGERLFRINPGGSSFNLANQSNAGPTTGSCRTSAV